MFNVDRPIERPEQDVLHMSPFASSLALAIAKQPIGEGLVIGINGKWGSGKTSAINLAVRVLQKIESDEGKPEAQRTLVYQFEPWLHQCHEALIVEFFSGIANVLEKPFGHEVGAAFRRIASHLVSRSASFLSASAIVVDAAGGSGTAAAGLSVARELATQIPASWGKDSLKKHRDDLRTLLFAQNKRILVVIDDLDRLSVQDLKLILSMVKSIADLPGLIYILPIDANRVERLISGGSLPEHHLEKIVQVMLDLPEPSRDGMNRYFSSGLHQVTDGQELEHDESDWDRAGIYILNGYLTTPRKANRLVNRLRVSFPACGKETYFPDLVAIEALREFEPKAYSYLQRTRERLARGITDPKEKEKIKQSIRRVLSKKNSGFSLCQYLFPTLGGYSNTTFGFLNRPGRRISDPAGVDAYFRWTVEPGVISVQEIYKIQDALANRSDVDVLVKSAAEQVNSYGARASSGILEAIIEGRLIDNGSSDLLQSIVANSHLLTDIPAEADWIFSARSKLYEAIPKLLLNMPLDKREGSVSKIISSDSISIFASAFFLESIAPSVDDNENILTPEDLKVKTLDWFERAKARIVEVESGPGAGILIRVVAASLGKDVGRSCFDLVKHSPVACGDIAISLMSRVNSSSRSRIYYSLNRNPDHSVYDLRDILNGIENLERSSLTEITREGLLTFKVEAEKIVVG